MATLYIINHLKDTIKDAITIANNDYKISPNIDYKISPVEVDFEYVVSLLDKFDHVFFDKKHDNYAVLVRQVELELIYNKKIYEHGVQVLDRKKLNFFGCSHTYGIGHETKTTSYPDVLSSMLGLEYVNYGMPGKGNYAIEDLLTQFNITNSKLIVQFTDMYRVRYINNDKIIHDKIYQIKHKHPVLFSEENLFFNFKQIVSRVVNRLRDGNNKFLITYTNNMEDKWAIEANLFLHGFKEYCSTVGIQVDKATDGLHFGILSHKILADRLCCKWLRLYENNYGR